MKTLSTLLFDQKFSDTERCGFYSSESFPHGGPHGGSSWTPSGGETNEAGLIENEQTPMIYSENVPQSMDTYNPRPNRRRREDDALDSGSCLILSDILYCLHSDNFSRSYVELSVNKSWFEMQVKNDTIVTTRVLESNKS